VHDAEKPPSQAHRLGLYGPVHTNVLTARARLFDRTFEANLDRSASSMPRIGNDIDKIPTVGASYVHDITKTTLKNNNLEGR
jgi:hypothetical protein